MFVRVSAYVYVLKIARVFVCFHQLCPRAIDSYISVPVRAFRILHCLEISQKDISQSLPVGVCVQLLSPPSPRKARFPWHYMSCHATPSHSSPMIAPAPIHRQPPSAHLSAHDKLVSVFAYQLRVPFSCYSLIAQVAVFLFLLIVCCC